jgi:hypothetical protein
MVPSFGVSPTMKITMPAQDSRDSILLILKIDFHAADLGLSISSSLQ